MKGGLAMNRKGMSTVVVTVIMIALVLVAVGIVWAVISGIIESTADDAEVSQACLGASIVIRDASCSGGECQARVERAGTGNTEINSLEYVFTGGDSDIDGSKGSLEVAVSISETYTGTDPTSITVLPVIEIDGEEYNCNPITKEF